MCGKASCTAFPMPSTALRSIGITASASRVRSGRLSVMPFIMSMPSVASSFLMGRKLFPSVTMKRLTELSNIWSIASPVLDLTMNSRSRLPCQPFPSTMSMASWNACIFSATLAALSSGHLPKMSVMVARR